MTSERGRRLAAYRSIQRRYRPDRRQFDQLVAEALSSLPSQFRKRLENVAIVVQERSPGEFRGGRGPCRDDGLLGLYQGTPLAQRGVDYHLAAPDRITLYRGPILAQCRDRAEVVREVRDTLIHEIGHYFGLAEEELP